VDTVSEIPQQWLMDFVAFIPRLILALVIFVVALAAAGLFSRLVREAAERRQTDPELTLVLRKITRWGTILLGSVVALQQVDFDLTAFVAGLGILGFTIGFAIQDVSKNFIAGLLLLLQQPFDIGDAIKVAEFSGTVANVDLRATEIRTFDGVQVLIPNADVFTSAIVNYSRTNRRRIDINVGVAYESDLEFVRETALEAIGGIAGVLTDPAPMLIYNNLGPSTVDFTIYYWVDTEQVGFFDATDTGVATIKAVFEEAGIDMPYPIQTVYVRQ
jgi:small conductance mechanosensitive channel